VTLLKIKGVIGDLADVLTEEVVDDVRAEDGLQMRLFVRLEFIRAVQVDGQRRHLHEGSACVPVLGNKLVSVLNDDFTGKGKISIEPRPPQTTTIRHDVDLVAAKLFNLASGGNFEHGAISVATDNFVVVDGLETALITGQESANR